MALTIPSDFPTAAEIKSAIQSVRGSSSDIPTVTDEQVTAARRWAYGEIFSRLVARGYSKAQIDSWDLLWEYGRDLALWKQWRERIGSQQDGGKDVERLPEHWDRRTDLDAVLLTTDGEEIEIDDATAYIGYGNVTFDGSEKFNTETEW